MSGPNAPEERRRASGLFRQNEWHDVARSLRLSDRESQIAQYLIVDATEAMIARQLGISCHTVHTYLVRLYRKLGVTSRCELLVRIFLEHPAIKHFRALGDSSPTT